MTTYLVNTLCPVCQADAMPNPRRIGRNVVEHCGACGVPCRVSFSDMADGSVRVSYSPYRNHRKSVVKRVSVEFGKLIDTNDFRQMVLDKYGIVI